MWPEGNRGRATERHQRRIPEITARNPAWNTSATLPSGTCRGPTNSPDPHKHTDSLPGLSHLSSPADHLRSGWPVTDTSRPLLVHNLSLTPTHRLSRWTLQRGVGGREVWLREGSGSSQGKELSRERIEQRTRPGRWNVGRGGKRARRGVVLGTDWRPPGRGRSLAGYLRTAEGWLCVNFSSKMGPQIQDGDTGACPESAARQINP